MEAPLLDDAKDCCLSALRGALSIWLDKEYAPHMDPTPLDMAVAQMSLDSLIYDMRNGITMEYMKEHPECLVERDEYMSKRMVKWLREHGFQVSVNDDGVINAEEITQIFTGEQSGWEVDFKPGEFKDLNFEDEDNHDWT
tara:strand:- start:5573 stop:5992 length:420 start_codon:yes stop_codon:yes gene_type:complete